MDTTAALDFSSFISSLFGMVSMKDILTFLGLGLAASGVFVLGWMGVKKLIKMFKGAVTKGNVSV